MKVLKKEDSQNGEDNDEFVAAFLSQVDPKIIARSEKVKREAIKPNNEDDDIAKAFFMAKNTDKISVPKPKQSSEASDQSIYDAFFSKPVAKVAIPPLPSQAATNPLLAGTKLTNIPPLPAKVPNNPLV